MESITLSEVLELLLLLLLFSLLLLKVVEFAKTFLDSHSLESLYYGNLSKEQVRELTIKTNNNNNNENNNNNNEKQ